MKTNKILQSMRKRQIGYDLATKHFPIKPLGSDSMPELVADCPRCGAGHITFDLKSHIHSGTKHGWQKWYEAFCVCRHCHRSTIFRLAEISPVESDRLKAVGIEAQRGAVNSLLRVEGYISRKDMAGVESPEHVPEQIRQVFVEGATCLAVECFNAAGSMFRLCIDLVTKSLLPEDDINGLNNKIRRNLGLRLPWLFDNNLLPEALRELSTCIKEDGNDGAHDGTLTKAEAEDLLDFTTILLERFYTEPEQLRLAKERRDKRREQLD